MKGYYKSSILDDCRPLTVALHRVDKLTDISVTDLPVRALGMYRASDARCKIYLTLDQRLQEYGQRRMQELSIPVAVWPSLADWSVSRAHLARLLRLRQASAQRPALFGALTSIVQCTEHNRPTSMVSSSFL